MLISRNRKFLFVHIQKTGGTSLRQALSEALPDLTTFLGTHDPASAARAVLGEEWKSYFKVAFVRNPWDRLVSWYAMIRQQVNYSNRFWEYVRSRASSFEDFLRHCTDTIEDHDGVKSIVRDQLDYVADSQGNVIVDFVGRYENLQRDAVEVFRRLGLEPPALPHTNRSEHAHYSRFYTEQTRNLVAQRHRRDLAVFGYRFESVPELASDQENRPRS